MNYQNYYRTPGYTLRRQDAGYDIGEPMGYETGMRNTEPMGQMPGMRNTEPMGQMPGMRNGEPVGCMPDGYAPTMEMQPEYGGMPYGMQPRNMDLGRQQPSVMPYYQMPGYPQTLWQEMESERDARKLKEMYPDAAKEILPYVEEECDKMEYDGSVMFDEYPDRVMMGKIRNNIYDRVKGRFELPEDEDRDEVFAMNRETRRRYPPRKNWMGDLIDVLLFQEMHRRRCRHRNCRGWR